MYTSINTDMGGTTLTEQPLILSAKRCADGNGTLSYLFFSDEWVDVQRAKAICSKCSRRESILIVPPHRREVLTSPGIATVPEIGRLAGLQRASTLHPS